MEEKESLKRIVEFRTLLRTKLESSLLFYNYKLTYDNDKLDSGDQKRWIFKLEYTGSSIVTVMNKDWRDYIEYFHVNFNSKEILIINIENYRDLTEPYELIEKSIINEIHLLT